MVEVKVSSIRASLMSEHRVVILKEVNVERYLPIWIGPYEAEAIALRLQNREVARPLTHDLLHNVIAEMGGKISHITVTDLREDTFFGCITVRVNGRQVDIDSRPSDAIALAVRANVPIFVEEHVMTQAGIVPEADVGAEPEDEALSPFRDFIDSLNLDDLPLQKAPQRTRCNAPTVIAQPRTRTPATVPFRPCRENSRTSPEPEAGRAAQDRAANVDGRSMSTPDKMIPHNVEAEESVLGSLLIDPEALFRVSPFLRGEDFYIQKNAWIYDAIFALHERREPIDFVTLCDELERRGQLEEIGGAAYITHLINIVPSAIHVEAYGHIVEQAAIRRRLISTASQIAQLAYQEAEDIDQTVDQAEQALFSVSQRRITRDLAPIQDVIRRYYDRIEYLYAHQGEPLGVPTGYVDLDRLLGGLQRSDFVIIAARPSVGKTSLCLSIGRNAARHGQRVAVFSLEMSAEQIVQRLVSAETGIDAQRLRLGNLRDEEWPLFVQATGKLADLAIFIDDTPSISALQLRTKARRLHAEHGLDLVLVDYLQLMTGDIRAENRVQEVSFISRSLKALARELDLPVVAASQLSRAVEQRTDKRPVLADLRESGCLTGDTLVQLANGQRVAIRRLAEQGIRAPVMALNETTWRLEPVEARKAWLTGVRPVFLLRTRLGREVRATANHKFRTLSGWKRLDQLEKGEHIALPRSWEQLTTQVGRIVQSETLSRLAESDVYWDQVANIEADGVEDVYDLEVPGHHNFVANDIVVHNSLEQDADVVMFIYRDEMYHPETERQHIADIIVAKHRNGPTGTIQLFFRTQLAQFLDAETRRQPVEFS